MHQSFFTKDELFIINEFKNLKLNCIEINESFQSSIQSIIDIYLKSNSFLLNFKNGFGRDHPLSEYSLNVLVQFEIGYNYWKDLQSINFESISNYCNKFDEIELNLKNITEIVTPSSGGEKELIFLTINKQFNEKVEKFDNSIILIQLAIPQIFQFLSNLHSNSSEILLNKPIKYKNPIDGKYKQLGSLVSSFFTYFQKQDSTTVPQQLQQQQKQLKNNIQKQELQSKQLIETNENKSILSKLFSKVSITNTLLFLNPPTIDKLLDDHSTHQKLWDSKIWIKNKIYSHSVSSELVQTFTFKQPCSLFLWVKFWMSIPPTYQNQTIKKSSFTLHDIDTDQLLLDSMVIDRNAFQPVSLISSENPKTTSFKIKYRIEADIYRCEMKSISEAEVLELQINNNNNNTTIPSSSPTDTTIINFEPISDKEIKHYKRSTSKINHDTPEFKEFIEKYRLYRKQIPTTESSSSNITSLESILSFAYRVSIFLKINLKFISPPPGNTEALNTFQNGGGDCACLTHLAAAILRYNDIPARILYGTISAETDLKECRHVKIEFYNTDVGLWFPYDPSDISTIDPYYRTHFANDPNGNFITHHIDPIFDVPVLGTNETRESVFQVSSFKYFYPGVTPPIFDSITSNFSFKREPTK